MTTKMYSHKKGFERYPDHWAGGGIMGKNENESDEDFIKRVGFEKDPYLQKNDNNDFFQIYKHKTDKLYLCHIRLFSEDTEFLLAESQIEFLDILNKVIAFSSFMRQL